MRLDLPLVDQARCGAGKDEAGVELGGPTSFGVDVQQHLAGCDLAGGGGLSTRFGSFDHDGADRTQTLGKFTVDDATTIPNGENEQIVAGRMMSSQRGD